MKHSSLACFAVFFMSSFAQASSSYASTVVSVRTAVPGGNADFVEAEVTFPLERALLNVPGVKLLRASSRSELSIIEIGISDNRACEALASTVAAIASFRTRLPATIGEPLVTVSSEIKCQ